MHTAEQYVIGSARLRLDCHWKIAPRDKGQDYADCGIWEPMEGEMKGRGEMRSLPAVTGAVPLVSLPYSMYPFSELQLFRNCRREENRPNTS